MNREADYRHEDYVQEGDDLLGEFTQFEVELFSLVVSFGIALGMLLMHIG